MIHRTVAGRAAVAFLLTALAAGSARAGGMWAYESGQTDIGTATAGRAALARDASTAFGNPAGMTRLGSQIQVGLQPTLYSATFDVGPATNVPGTDGGDAGGFLPLAGLYGVYSIDDDLKLGAALNSYAGGDLNYEDNWVGRYYATESALLTFNFNPVIAYRVLPWLSLGAGFSVQWAKMTSEIAINNVAESLADGRMEFSDTNFGFGGNFGALFEIDPRSRVGLSYRSQVGQDFDDVPTFGQLGPGLDALLRRSGVLGASLGLDVTIPQEVMLSAYHELSDEVALMANFNWQDWSQFGDLSVSLDTEPARARAVDANFDDTFQAAVGAHVRLAEPTLLQVGFAYDTSPVGEANRSVALPVDRQLRFALGAQYEVNEDYTIGAAYEFISLGGADIDQSASALKGTVEGDYDQNSLNVFNLTVIRRF